MDQVSKKSTVFHRISYGFIVFPCPESKASPAAAASVVARSRSHRGCKPGASGQTAASCRVVGADPIDRFSEFPASGRGEVQAPQFGELQALLRVASVQVTWSLFGLQKSRPPKRLRVWSSWLPRRANTRRQGACA